MSLSAMLDEERDFEKGLKFPLQTRLLYALYCLRDPSSKLPRRPSERILVALRGR
jgi:hypothetical protein